MTLRKNYEPPVAVSLSASAVNGQQVEIKGSCEPGGQLTSGFCTNGTNPAGGTCAPTGFVPERGYCRTGQQAVEGCTSGAIHT